MPVKTCNMYQDIEYVSNDAVRHTAALPPPPVVSSHNNIHIGELLETARLKRGMTVQHLSNRVKIASSILNKFETGQQNPDVCAMHILTAELDITLGKD